MTISVRKTLAAALTALALSIAPLAVPASAHDELLGTTPADGAEVADAPSEITLSFSGEIADIGAEVVLTGGLDDIVEGAPEVRGTEVVQAISTDTPPGDYEVVWRVTSQDGHPISGAFGYTVEDAGIAAQGEAEATTEVAPATSAPAADEELATATDDLAPATANSDAAVVPENSQDGEGTPIWVWFVLGGALAALGGVGWRAASRR
ncbi:copper resistance CopC family protein [Ornithinimicrobium sp. INDO-MA30-4]|uniref:copper resistance CopC family protein n=1 Tax=Ornithinimicrobium sp. INDO-MA30-4 TaxID=2908651 RepID=UPI001F34A74C|nr:copper resistance CopC family protein [Ornithinimicrobium sp. INDO-MA30-4]UJH69737.1 copper resistance protein CopC [Ornithinimicrobium sp. INDO-MA30-4]